MYSGLHGFIIALASLIASSCLGDAKALSLLPLKRSHRDVSSLKKIRPINSAIKGLSDGPASSKKYFENYIGDPFDAVNLSFMQTAILRSSAAEALTSPITSSSLLSLGNADAVSSILSPSVAVDTKKLLANYPFKIPSLNIPNAYRAGEQALSNVGATMPLIPGATLGGPKEMAKTAAQIGKQALVTANYMVLAGAMGLQPIDNKSDGEYRRVTQAPEVRFNIQKQEDINPTMSSYAMPENLISEAAKKEYLQQENSQLQQLLVEEKSISDSIKIAQKNHAKMMEPIIGTESTQDTNQIKEEVAMAAPPIISHTFFPSNNDRVRARGLIKNTAWLPRARRTLKTTTLENAFPVNRPIKRKKSPFELLEQQEILGSLKEQVRAQLQPTRDERYDYE